MYARLMLGLVALAVSTKAATAQTPYLTRTSEARAVEDKLATLSNETSCPAPACCPPCGPAGCAWTNFEWLFWVTSGQPLPPLITTSPPGTPQAAAGVLGIPTTTTLFGGSRANDDVRSGFRFNGGFWLNDCHTCGIEGDFFFLGQSRQGLAAASDGSTILARPFFNVNTGLPDAQLVTFPGLAGSTSARATSNIIGGGLNAIHNLCCSPCGRLDFLWGYRYFNLTDEVEITEDLLGSDGARFQILDRFRTSNNFNGGVLGLSGEYRFNGCFVGGRATVALGSNQQITQISGFTTITPPGGTPTTLPGGLLALPSNIGEYQRDAFAVMPEVTIRGGVQCTERMRIYAGYTFLYLSNVARAGDQIDLRVNPNQLPPPTGGGPAFPQFTGRTTDFFIHGVSIGAELRY